MEDKVFMNHMRQISAFSQDFLNTLPPHGSNPISHVTIPTPQFLLPKTHIKEDLEQRGCSSDVIGQLLKSYERGLDELKLKVSEAYQNMIQSCCATDFNSFCEAASQRFQQKLNLQADCLRQMLLDEVDAARAKVEEDLEKEAVAPGGRPERFTLEQVEALGKMRDQLVAAGKDLSLSKTERIALATRIGLDQNQIKTWFGNVRARGNKAPPASTASPLSCKQKRATPYPNGPRRPSGPSTTTNLPLPTRNFSNSSASSLDSILSYESDISVSDSSSLQSAFFIPDDIFLSPSGPSAHSPSANWDDSSPPSSHSTSSHNSPVPFFSHPSPAFTNETDSDNISEAEHDSFLASFNEFEARAPDLTPTANSFIFQLSNSLGTLVDGSEEHHGPKELLNAASPSSSFYDPDSWFRSPSPVPSSIVGAVVGEISTETDQLGGEATFDFLNPSPPSSTHSSQSSSARNSFLNPDNLFVGRLTFSPEDLDLCSQLDIGAGGRLSLSLDFVEEVEAGSGTVVTEEVEGVSAWSEGEAGVTRATCSDLPTDVVEGEVYEGESVGMDVEMGEF
ncbi:hypothetical protein T439DRAFT_383960 [Meredithblackwellia eburnea MCA 4105]